MAAPADVADHPQPLRVVVVGNSTALYVRPRRTGVADRTYGQELQRGLREHGVAAWVTNEARWWEQVHQALARWEGAVHGHQPDVVVMNYGIIDCQAKVLPGWLLRWVYSWRPSLHPVARALRTVVVRPLQRLIATLLPLLCRLVGQRTARVSPARFRAELARLVEITRRETGALVLVLTINPPGPALRARMPGIDRRAERYSALIRTTVDSLGDPDARVIDVEQVIERVGRSAAIADGLHYTPVGHREVAAELQRSVLGWLDASG